MQPGNGLTTTVVQGGKAFRDSAQSLSILWSFPDPDLIHFLTYSLPCSEWAVDWRLQWSLTNIPMFL